MILLFFMVFIISVSAWGSILRQEKDDILKVIPFAFNIILLALYILAFFNKMWLMDYALVLASLVACILSFTHKIDVKQLRNNVLNRKLITWGVVTIIGMLLLSDRAITGFDELNFWGPSVKSIYYLEGYAEKGYLVAPAYGDYPPVSQLLQAYFMHLMGKYDEGIQMSGFYFFIMVYMAPLLTVVVDSWMLIPAAFLLSCLPAIVSNALSSRSPDIIMGAIWGLSLLMISKRRNTFDDINISLSLAVLVLVKSIGIEWALLSIVFYCILRGKQLKDSNIHWIIIISFPLLIYFSWVYFCRINERVTYLTQTIKVKVGASEEFKNYGSELAKVFWGALFRPLQNEGIFGISYVGVMLLTILFLYRTYKKHGNMHYLTLGIFILLTGVLEILVLLYSVEVMFIGEYSNYLDPEHMLLLVKRYGSPYTFGCLTILTYICLEYIRKSTNNNVKYTSGFQLLLICFMFCFVPWKSYLTDLALYRLDDSKLDYAYENQAITYEDKTIGECIDIHSKILVVLALDNENFDIMRFRYELAPVVSVYEYFTSFDNVDTFKNYIGNNKITHIYIINDYDNAFYSLTDGGIQVDRIYEKYVNQK